MIITQLAVLILIGMVTMLWRRTHQIGTDLQATRQEVKAQRIVMNQPDTPPKRQRRLHVLAVFV